MNAARQALSILDRSRGRGASQPPATLSCNRRSWWFLNDVGASA